MLPMLIWKDDILSLNSGVCRPREGLSRSLFLWHFLRIRTITMPLVSWLRSSSLLKSKQKCLQYQNKGALLVSPCVALGCPGCAPAWRDAMAWDKFCCAASQPSRMVVWPHKEQLERDKECHLVLFLWPYFSIYKEKGKANYFWTWIPVKFCFHTSNMSVWKRPFQREVWSAPFICLLWLTGVTCTHSILPALWHCWTKALASERQGSSGASSASDKVMRSWFLLCTASLDVFKLNTHQSPMYADQ